MAGRRASGAASASVPSPARRSSQARGFAEHDASLTPAVGEFVEDGYKRIGTRVRPMGEALAQGLSPASAQELGLLPGITIYYS
jgi:hypothetical protein